MTARPPRGFSRRRFLQSGAVLASTHLTLREQSSTRRATPVSPAERAKEAHRVRMAAASVAAEHVAALAVNGDEADVLRYAAMYSKGLPHNALGEVDANAYRAMLRALRTGSARDFAAIPCAGDVKLTNPQGGLSFNLIGPDPAAISCPPPPRFSGAEQGVELVELYWQAQARDVPFGDYERNPVIHRAASELTLLRGAKTTPATIFRGSNRGSLAGPYLSQFLWKEILYAPLSVIQKIRPAPAGHDYPADYDAWLRLQNGVAPTAVPLETQRCYVRHGRDLAEYVHRDFSYQAALSAALILVKMGAPVNPDAPYAVSRTESGFTTFGPPHLLFVIATVTHAALTACWYQKWMAHRRLRPEEFAGRVANHVAGRASYPLHDALLDSDALAATLRARSNALLTSSYPEGSPTHPAYPAGHAVIAAAGTTALKVFFDESFVIPEPFVCGVDGLSLKRYDGPRLTVGGELDKLATNIGMGRCFGGIHWRSDVEEGVRLGEEVAIRTLREILLTTTEPFSGIRFHRLNGDLVRL